MNNNRVGLNLVGILAVYFLYAAIMTQIPQRSLGSTFPLTPTVFMADFRQWALAMVGISLVCMLAWYALGEWGLKPWSSSGTWWGVWLGLLVVVFGAGLVVSYLWMGPTVHGMNSTVAPYFLLGGTVSYYLASVFFSPAPAKYLVWPAKLVRSW